MVQTVISKTILAGQKRILIEKPRVLNRVFFSITALADPNAWYKSEVSFDDPLFRSFFVLNGPARHFEVRGKGIFQGNIWVCNLSDHDLEFTATEILV